MRIFLRPSLLKRYRDFAVLLVRHGRADLVRMIGLDRALDGEASAHDTSVRAQRLSSDLEELGPTFVKLGQVLSTRADILPDPYLEALARLQDSVAPVPFEDVARVVEAELGRPVDSAFAEFERTPLAAASLGQVHLARLADGRRVAVKVQRPGVHDLVDADVAVLADVAAFLDAYTELGRRFEFSRIVEEFAETIAMELDYRREAAHLSRFRTNLARFERLLVPAPVMELTSSRVLTMDYVVGTPMKRATPAQIASVDGPGLAEELFRAYLDQVLVHGLFHADPHPGNVLMTEDGRLALLDLGMVGRVREGLRPRLLELLLALGEGRGDRAAAVALEIGDVREERLDLEHFTTRISNLVAREHTASVGEMQVGKLVLEICRIAGDNGVLVPHGLTLLGKALLNLDQIARALAPDFNPSAAVRRHGSALLARQLWRSTSPGGTFQSLLASKELIEQLPARVNRIFDLVASNRMKLRVDVLDEKSFIVGLQRIANRIATGVLLGSLVIGTGLLMRVEVGPKVLGYPAVPLVLFLVAALGALAFVARVLWKDFRDR